MEAKHDNHNGNLPPSPPPSTTIIEHNDRFKQIIRFYSFKFHFITVPIGIIVAIIHLRFAIQYYGQCPIQPMINIYMIVHAVVHVSVMLLTFIAMINIRCVYSRGEDGHKAMAHVILIIVLVLTFVLMLFSLGWLIAGSIWIFGANINGVQGSDPTARTTYCQPDLFHAAFTLLIVNYVIHGLMIIGIILRRICGKKKETIQPSFAMNGMGNKI